MVRGSNPLTLAHQGHPDAGRPPAGLVLATSRRLPTASHQFCLPVQPLKPGVEYSVLLRQLILLLLEFCYGESRDKSYFRFGIPILSGTSRIGYPFPLIGSSKAKIVLVCNPLDS